ncbi:MAG: glycosyltransferase family 2 protein [Chitinophagaceae bacterium]|nr:glycosyltransferase family 2 protein [Chitinophagaceae bacterium]
MKISVVIPIYQEVLFIDSVFNFVINAAPHDKEIFFIDGGSNDGTLEYLEEKLKNGSNIKILNNYGKTVPFALNLAIPLCNGDIIVRLDAHTEYSKDYFIKIIDTFVKTGADIVGGPMRIANGSNLQNAIGIATTSKFGIGNSSFHFETYKGYTDSVYLGAWNKLIFDKIGLFDVFFKRNQDDEFHYRAGKNGLKIYQNPEIKLYYYPRNSYKKLFIQYFQYGLYKPMVLIKNSNGLSFRHLVPLFFVLYLLALPLLVCAFTGLFVFFPLSLYLFISLYFSFTNNGNFKEKLKTLLVYPIIHIGYGLGFILGIFIVLKK